MGGTSGPHHRDPRHSYEVEWTTVSYRTITGYAILAAGLAGFILYLIAPNYFGRKIRSGLAAISSGMVRPSEADAVPSKRDAHFLNIDGTVRVKKARSQQWIRADYNTSLEKGDFVQTMSDGAARIIFVDGTNYLLKPESLIVVEESREDPVTKAMKVAVQVTSGTVDLSTGKFEVPGTTSQVAFADAVANLAEETRAHVRHDPTTKQHEFTVNEGQADVTRGSTTVRLGQYEQVTFAQGEAGLNRQKVIAPPALLTPPNMNLSVSKDPKAENMEFSWSEVPGAVAYDLRVSPSGMFSNLVVDKRVTTASTQISGLEEGNYFWTVSAVDDKGVESQPSTPNRFNLVQEVQAGNQAYLDVGPIVLHGKVVEVLGRTEPGSTVIINNEQVFSIARDGTFRHFTSPLPKTGSNQITITAQNRRGDTHTIRKTVVIE